MVQKVVIGDAAIYNTTPRMTSREIADLTGKDLSHVHRDITVMLEQIGDDPEMDDVKVDRDARGYTTAIHLPKNLTITLVAGYSAKLRKAIIDRWQELEAKQAPSFTLPRTMAEALRLAADQAEQLEAQRPAVEFVERYATAGTGDKGFREVCKLLKANESQFKAWLIEQKIMYRLGGTLTGHQNHIDAGRFVIKAGEAHGHAFNLCKFSPKGVTWIAGEWAKHQISKA